MCKLFYPVQKWVKLIVLFGVVMISGCAIGETGNTSTDEPTEEQTAAATSTVRPLLTIPPATATLIPATSTSVPEPTRSMLEVVAVLEGSAGPVYSLDWSPDGGAIASAGHSQVNLWQEEWEQTSLPGHTSYVWAVEWSPDGSRLASGGQDKKLIIWDAASQEQIASLGEMWVFSIVWSPQADQVASGTSTRHCSNLGCANRRDDQGIKAQGDV